MQLRSLGLRSSTLNSSNKAYSSPKITRLYLALLIFASIFRSTFFDLAVILQALIKLVSFDQTIASFIYIIACFCSLLSLFRDTTQITIKPVSIVKPQIIRVLLALVLATIKILDQLKTILNSASTYSSNILQSLLGFRIFKTFIKPISQISLYISIAPLCLLTQYTSI